jgi:hypothetical protein
MGTGLFKHDFPSDKNSHPMGTAPLPDQGFNWWDKGRETFRNWRIDVIFYGIELI